MKADTDTQGAAFEGGVRGGRCCRRARCGWERNEEGVALRIDLHPAGGWEGVA